MEQTGKPTRKEKPPKKAGSIGVGLGPQGKIDRAQETEGEWPTARGKERSEARYKVEFMTEDRPNERHRERATREA